MTLSAGSRLGPYEILSPLGVGGMGEVYRARDKKLDRDVAIKVLPESVAADPNALARFEREAKAVAALSQPNILSIFDFGTHDGIAYAVMELLEGQTLRDKLDAGPIPRRLAVDYARQIAKGLAAAHEKGIVHRDLKPENLFVSRDDHLKILDFGLAKRTEKSVGEDETSAPTEVQYTEPGTVMGTVGYMSPEQVRGLPADHRSDIFSLGAVLYEMLSGRKAFKRATAGDTMAAILMQDPMELSESGREVSPALEGIVRHCLEKNREDRFQSAKDVAFALSEDSAPFSKSAGPKVTGPTARRGLRVGGTAAFVFLLAAAGFFFRYRQSATTATTPSIAVLPFTNLSGDQGQEYFSDGLSEELMDLLTKANGLNVAGRTSSFAFKGKTEELSEIGRKLHVGTVLEGSVRRAGDRLRVSARLVNVSDGYQVWAESYDRKLTDVFEVQDEIAGAVVSALKVRLLPQGRGGGSEPRTSNAEAHNQYLLGRQLASRATPETDRLAVAAYQRAIQLDPGYAGAYAALAGAEYWLAESAGGTPETVTSEKERARAAAEKAIALDPNLAAGYGARGLVRYGIDWNWVGAQADLERALSLDPGDMRFQIVESYILSSLGRLPEAIGRARKAIELDPLSARGGSNLGRYLSALGQLPRARQALERALEINPDDPYVHFNLGTTLLLQAQPKAALAEFRQAGQAMGLAGTAMAEHDLGHLRESKEALDELVARHAGDSALHIAEIYAWSGERDQAFVWLDTAYRQRDQGLAEIKINPLLARLSGDPRYAGMLRKMNLPVGPGESK